MDAFVGWFLILVSMVFGGLKELAERDEIRTNKRQAAIDDAMNRSDPKCPHCKGSGKPLGTWNRLRWYGCIHCGKEFFLKLPDKDTR